MLRVSGDKSLDISRRLCQLDEKEIPSHTCCLTTFRNEEGYPVDQVLLTYFEKGRSFTGDQTVEISCHGNPLIVNRIAQLYLKNGCRSAEKGEFSFRAFYNGNIDLIQAESIQQLVMSKSSYGSETFLSQLSGKLTEEFNHLEEILITCMAHLEATIDFIEQDIDPEDYQIIIKKLTIAEEKTRHLLDSYSLGKNLSRNFKILLLGETNVGKSSLFNWLIEKDRAIVTEVAGTTRDIVSDQTFIGNHSVEFFDSAGLRMTHDLVEGIGIEKTLKESLEADLILYVFDASQNQPIQTPISYRSNQCIFVFNKTDLLSGMSEDLVLKEFNRNNGLNISLINSCFVSVLKNRGRVQLVDKILDQIVGNRGPQESSMITQARHFDHLNNILNHLRSSLDLLKINESPDLISQEFALGLSEVHSILGKQYDDEVLDKIFSDFCIGK